MTTTLDITNLRTPDDVLTLCRHLTPVNVPILLAIQAHLKSLSPVDWPVARRALDVVILAQASSVEELQMQYDYFNFLPDILWPDGDGEWEKRQATKEAIRRCIAWRQQS